MIQENEKYLLTECMLDYGAAYYALNEINENPNFDPAGFIREFCKYVISTLGKNFSDVGYKITVSGTTKDGYYTEEDGRDFIDSSQIKKTESVSFKHISSSFPALQVNEGLVSVRYHKFIPPLHDGVIAKMNSIIGSNVWDELRDLNKNLQ